MHPNFQIVILFCFLFFSNFSKILLTLIFLFLLIYLYLLFTSYLCFYVELFVTYSELHNVFQVTRIEEKRETSHPNKILTGENFRWCS